MNNNIEETFIIPAEVENACEIYSSSEEIKFPITNSKNTVTLNKLEYSCKRCNSTIEKLRGSANFYDNYIELKIIGICPSCQIFAIFPKHRIYNDGRILQITQSGSQLLQTNVKKIDILKLIIIVLGIIFCGILAYFKFRS